MKTVIQEYRAMSLYTKLIEAGVKVENYYSDLHVPVTDETTEILKQSKAAGDVFIAPETFNIDGVLWYDIAFAYEPFFKNRECKFIRKSKK